MADSSSCSSSPKNSAAWERFYHLLAPGYAHIAEHPVVEAEILNFFSSLDVASIEGTELGREWKTFPTVFVNFLEAYRHNRETLILARMVEARYQHECEELEWAVLLADHQKKAVQLANDQAALLVRERERLTDRVAMFQACFEHDSRDILMKLKGEWLEDRVESLTVDIAYARALASGLEIAVEHYEANVARLKAACRRLFFRLAELEPQSAGCSRIINSLESQLSSFVMVIRTQFGFTLPPQ